VSGVLILVDNSRRDLLACRLLQQEFHDRGVPARLCSKRENIMALRRWRPDAYIASRGDSPWLRAASECCDVYVAPAEGARLTNETMTAVFTGRSGTGADVAEGFSADHFSFIKRAYLWGEETRDVLMGTGLFKPEQLLVAGNVRFDVYRQGRVPEQRRDKRFTVGVAFSAKSTSAFSGRLRYPATFYHLTKADTDKLALVPPGRHLEDWIWRDFAALHRVMGLMRRIVDETDWQMVLRVGTQEDIEEYAFLERVAPGRVRIQPRSGQLFEFFNDSDVLLTCSSTVGMEALAFGLPVVQTLTTVDREHLLRHIDPRTNGLDILERIYHSPRTDDEALELLGRARDGALSLTPDPEFLTGFLGRLYHWPPPTSAAAAIADDVLRDMAARPPAPASCFKRNLRFGNRTVGRLTDAVPLPDPWVMAAMGLGAEAKFLVDDWRTGALASNREHYRTKNPDVDALVRAYAHRTRKEG